MATTAATPLGVDNELATRMYRQMVRIRAFEEAANDLYRRAKMPGLTHLYSGQEAVAVGACEALRKDDFITSTHRGHGHCLAKGADVRRMFAELLGQEVLAVNEVVRHAVARGRSGDGPSFVVANTYRYYGHHVGDVDRGYYRSKDEEADWKTNRDPITRLGARLVDSRVARPEELERVASDAEQEIAGAVRYALDAPFPAES